MEKKFAVFDIDGTLFRSSLYRELAHEMMRSGLIKNQNFINDIQVKRLRWHDRESTEAYMEYDMAVASGVDAMLTTISVDDYEAAVRRTVAANTSKVYSYTRNLIRQLKSRGYILIAVSGSPESLVEQFALRYGFDFWVGQHWVKKGNTFTGEIIKTHTDKHLIVERLVEQYALTYDESYAIGDSEGDISILSAVVHPIAFNPTIGLLEAATKNGWDILIERKNVVYELQKSSSLSMHSLVKFHKV